MKFSIDRGGTFTDIYAEHNGRYYVEKLLSVDPANYQDAPREGIRRLLERIGTDIGSEAIPTDAIEWIRMGTTVATNALLEKKGARTALLITAGFGDLLRIGYQNRPKLFDLHIHKPDMLYEKIIEIEERVIPDGEGFGVLKAPDPTRIRKELEALKAEGFTSIAIVLLHAYRFSNHEKMIGELARKVGFDQISLSHEVSPSIKAVIRGDTTVLDAYLTPHIRHYIDTFASGFEEKLQGSDLLFMQSHGGLSPANHFRGSNAILSGPAGGVVGLSSLYRGKPLIGFDMGGTSTDVSRFDGTFRLRQESKIAGTTIRSPQLDILTVAAGGGSRLFYRNGMFVVGPESSGAHPGPVCYKKGGYLSITDANAVLGRLVPQYFPEIFGPDENEPLDVEASREAFRVLTDEINEDTDVSFTLEEVAYGFLKVANDTMSKPIIEVSLSRGFDLTKHILASFGGAGGQHACAIASGLGIEEMVVHRYAGILSAYGMSQADIVKNERKSINAALNAELTEKINGEFEKLESSYPEAQYTRMLLMRYEGIEYAILTEADQNGDFAKPFEAKYLQEFGFTLDLPITVDELHLQIRFVTEKIAREKPARNKSNAEVLGKTQLYTEEGWREAALYRFDTLGIEDKISGPALIIDQTSTIVVEPGATARIDHYGDLYLKISEGQMKRKSVSGSEVNAIDLSIFSNLYLSIARQMGTVLQNAALSANIKERLDFSCALFDAHGSLIANAPHIPVHLGSMSYVVREMLQQFDGEIEVGDVFLSNVPYEGGSHLPDLTVITPCILEGEIQFITASRGHHADIGGIVPGSMPSFSTKLEEEGARFTMQKIVSGRQFQEAQIRTILEAAGARRIDENISDIRAQIAANHKGIELLLEAVQQHGLETVKLYMDSIQQASFTAITQKLQEIEAERGSKLQAEDYLDDDSRIALTVTLDDGAARFDFAGTGPQLDGNQNTPRSVTSSAVVYALRTLIDQDLPLNEGLLQAVEIILPEKSLLNPDRNAAVVGGNVTTSQRIVDVIFRAFGNVAASQGCMNNITFGNGHFGYYETIGGGTGAGIDSAGKGFDGADAVHSHMTNTLITDPEIIEQRYPVIIEEFSIRKESGGRGDFKGGEGITRTYRFLEPVTVNLLTERRIYAPWGLNGAGDGATGENVHFRDRKWQKLEGKASIQVKAGEKIRIHTPGGGGCNRL